MRLESQRSTQRSAAPQHRARPRSLQDAVCRLPLSAILVYSAPHCTFLPIAWLPSAPSRATSSACSARLPPLGAAIRIPPPRPTHLLPRSRRSARLQRPSPAAECCFSRRIPRLQAPRVGECPDGALEADHPGQCRTRDSSQRALRSHPSIAVEPPACALCFPRPAEAYHGVSGCA